MGSLQVRLVALLLVLCGSWVLAKSYRFLSIEQDIYLEPSGQVRVVDVSTYQFEGTFSYAFMAVDPAPGGRVIFEGVEALDGKAPTNPKIEGNTIRWDSPASNETRVFRVTYRLTGEAQVANDAAKLDRQVLEPGHVRVDKYVLRIHAPAPSPERFRVFIFTSLSRIGTLDFDESRSVSTITLAPLSDGEAVRAKVLLPSRVFNTRTINANKFEDWLAETERETRDFRNQSERAVRDSGNSGGFATQTKPVYPPLPGGWILLAFLVAAATTFWFWSLFNRFGKEPRTTLVGRYYREPAEELPPGVVPYVTSQRNPGVRFLGRAISATLLDWARNRLVEIVHQKRHGLLRLGVYDEVSFKFVGPLPAGASEFEQKLWGELRAASGPDDVVSPTEIKRHFRETPDLGRALSALPREWYQRTFGLLLDETAAGTKILLLVVSGLLGTMGIALGLWWENPNFQRLGFVFGLAMALLTLIAALVLPRWNKAKLLNAKRWLAYKNFLADFSQMERAPAEHYRIWDYHFVYATALGVAQEYLHNIGQIMNKRPEEFTTPGWINASTAASMRDTTKSMTSMLAALNTISQISTNLSNLNRALGSSPGSSGGFGGGSMGGSSGGGGSRGAG